MSKSQNYPLTDIQLGIWLAQMVSADRSYVIGECLELFGKVDDSLLRKAVVIGLNDADSLHLRLVETGEVPTQAVMRLPEIGYRELDFSECSDPLSAAEKWMREDLNARLDLFKDCLYSLAHLRLSQEHSIFYCKCHHLIADGLAASLLIGRLAENYNALLEGHSPGAFIASNIIHGSVDSALLNKADRLFQNSDDSLWIELPAKRPSRRSRVRRDHAGGGGGRPGPDRCDHAG